MKRFILTLGLASAVSVNPMVLSQAFAQAAPYGQPSSSYVLTFSDEFNGTQLDSRKWNTHFFYDPPDNTPNYAVEGGYLKMWPERLADGSFPKRTIDTDSGKFSQRYGYFEMEAKLPYGRGPWPAFWLWNHSGSTFPEIDIMEAYPGGGPASEWSDANLHANIYGTTIWLDSTTRAGFKMVHPEPPQDLSTTFHKYAVKWEANRIIFYFDGKEVYRKNARINVPMYVLLDLWYGSASNPPDSTTPTGKTNAFEINYVRIWRNR
jgi:beta-glucanase (GH16 family)